MDILDDMGVGKLSAKVFLKVNYSFNKTQPKDSSLSPVSVHQVRCVEISAVSLSLVYLSVRSNSAQML